MTRTNANVRHRSGSLLVVTALVMLSCTGSPTTPTSQTHTTRTSTPSPTVTVDPNVPRARAYAQMADAPGDAVLLYGGQYGVPPGTALSDVWSFSPKKGWTLLELANEDAEEGDGFEHVASTGLVVVVSGNDTWTFDPGTGRWQASKTRGHPVHVWGTRFAYDAESDRVIGFGGLDASPFTLFDDTWALDVERNTWTHMRPKVSPPPENFVAMTYDPLTDRVIMFNTLGQTWAYDYDGDSWTNLHPRPAPDARTYSAMEYDPVGERIILFGGVTEGLEEPFGDTWAYDPVANEWTELRTDTAPSPRGWHAMAADAETGMIYLFSGGETRDTDLADLWRFDPRRDRWEEVT